MHSALLASLWTLVFNWKGFWERERERERERMAEEKGMSPWEQHSAVIKLPRFDYNAPSSLLRNSHSGFLITCTISSVSSLSFFLYLPPSSFSFFSISLSRAREKRYKRSNLYPSQGQLLFLCFCNKFVFQYYSYIVISYSSLGRVIITL